MRQVIVVAVLAIVVTGCASYQPRAAPPVQRVQIVCPTDDQLKDTAIEVSKATYRNAPGGSRTCACPNDTFERNGQQVPCASPGAIRPATWVMCQRTDVPVSLLAKMKAKLSRQCISRIEAR